MPCPILEFRNVSHRAGDALLLDDINWQVAPGEHWALLGPNGSGKTTLLNVACGYIWPNTTGEVIRCGESMGDLRLLRRSIGWVSCNLLYQIPPLERVLDTVVSGRVAQVGLKHIGIERPTTEDYCLAEKYLDELSSGHLVDLPFSVLSQGERQKVLIARARMAEPLLLFLDEPCAGLDPGAREQFLEALEDLAGRKDTPNLVLVTHHLEEIMPAFQHTLLMSEGRIVGQGKTQSVINEQGIRQLYELPLARLEHRNDRFRLSL